MANAQASTLHLTEETFDAEALSGEQPVLVDFWAPWCPPCRALGPTIDALADEFQGRAKVAKVDVDKHPALASRFAVQSIPTIVFLKNGREVGRAVGLTGRDQLAARLEALASA